MNWQYTPYVLPLIAAAAITAALALAAVRRRHVPGATEFAWLMATAAWWSLCYALELASADLPTLMIWTNAKFLGVAFLPVAWFAFALQYSGRERWLTLRNVALLSAVPLMTQLVIWTDPLHHLFRHEFALDTSGAWLTLTVTTQGTWFWVHTVYSYLLLVLGMVMLMQGLVRSARLYRGQAISLLVGALVPWVVNVLYTFGLTRYVRLDPTPFAFTVTGLAFAWGLFRFRLLDVVPAARSAVVEGMSDGVLVLDAQNRIVELNPAAQRIMGRTAAQAIGQSALQILPDRSDLVEHFWDATETQAEITLQTGNVPRYYDMRLSPLYDRQQHLTGRLIVLRDVTERKLTDETLERWVAQFKVVPEVAQEIAAAREPDELLRHLVDLVKNRLGFYHVAVFLMDEQGKHAVLRTSTDRAGGQTLPSGYRLQANGAGIVGSVVSTGQVRIAYTDSAHLVPPSLPETRSEIALPLQVGRRVIGALDVHSTQATPFDEAAIAVLQTIANQLTVAIENARLLRDMQISVRELERTSVRYTEEAWRRLSQAGGRSRGYRYQNQSVEPIAQPHPEAQQAWQQGHSVITVVQPEAGENGPNALGAVAVPIRVRDQVIGALNIRLEDQVTPETIALVQEVADRLALTLESARLYEDTQHRAARERLATQVTTRMRETLDVETVLKTAVQEVRQALNLPEVVIRLVPPPGDGHEQSKEALS